jgi:hypothetical protein
LRRGILVFELGYGVDWSFGGELVVRRYLIMINCISLLFYEMGSWGEKVCGLKWKLGMEVIAHEKRSIRGHLPDPMDYHAPVCLSRSYDAKKRNTPPIPNLPHHTHPAKHSKNIS